MSRRPVVIVFAKAPRLGAVKTRLAAGIGDLAALRVYRGLLLGTLRRMARDRRWRVVLAVTPDRARVAGMPRPVLRLGQGRGDLGRRMARALARMAPSPALVIGGDIPGATASHMAKALRALAAADIVFGPAEDGGYWLVGVARRVRPLRLFDGVRWSSPDALADSLAVLPPHWRVALADTLADVDDAAALARAIALTRSG